MWDIGKEFTALLSRKLLVSISLSEQEEVSRE